MNWETTKLSLYEGKRVRRVVWPDGMYLDLKAGKYRLFREVRKVGTNLINSDMPTDGADFTAEDWEEYQPLFYSGD